MAEIPIHVLVPPDKTPSEKEEAWRNRQGPDGLGIEIAPGSCLPEQLVFDLHWYLRNIETSLPVDEGERIRFINEAHTAQDRGDRSQARKLWKEAQRADKRIQSSYQSITMTIAHAREKVENYIRNKRQDQWGDPDMPDLGLDFEAYESMPDEAIIAWAKSLGMEIDKALG